HVLRREDIDVDVQDFVRVFSSQHIFLGSEGDLPVRTISSRNDDRIQVKVGGSITDVAEANFIAIDGGQIVLESSRAHVGTLEEPLQIHTSGDEYLIARGKDDVVIRQAAQADESHDLYINQVFSRNGTVQLRANGKIVDALNTDSANIAAAEITLIAGQNIGTPANQLDIDLSGDGILNVTTTGGNVDIAETTGNLGIGQIEVDGDITLTADISILDTVDDITENQSYDISAGDVILTAENGSIGSAGNEIDIDTAAGRHLISDSKLDTFINETTGDLNLFSVITGDDNTAFIAALAGDILANPIPNHVINGGSAWLFAAGSIGSVDQPITTSVGAVEGIAVAGDVNLENDAPIIVGGVTGGSGNGTSGESTGHNNNSNSNSKNSFDNGDLSGENTGTGRDGLHSNGTINLRTNGDVTIRERLSGGGNIQIRTGGVFNLENGGSIQTPAAFALIAGQDDSDTIVNLLGNIQSDSVSVETGDGDDTVTTNNPRVAFAAGAGTDTLRFTGAGDTFDLSNLPAGGLSGLERLDLVNGTDEGLYIDPSAIAALASETGYLQLTVEPTDIVNFSDDWTPGDPIIVDGQIAHIITDPNGTTLRLANAVRFANPVQNLDVDGDGRIIAVDALQVIQKLSAAARGNFLPNFSQPLTDSDLNDFRYFDTNADNLLSPVDALIVIQELARRARENAGEQISGEQILSPSNLQTTDAIFTDDDEQWLPTKTF
ncbi:MAG: dockerin type I domain-containing protein, partial [Planctomycetota bacterium]